MGTYSQLYIADYPVCSEKGGVNPEVMTIFRESDKRIYKRKFSERNQLAWGHVEDDGQEEVAYEYSNTTANIRQRLDVMGFSLKKVEREFYEVLQEEIEEIKRRREGLSDSRYRDAIDAEWSIEQTVLESNQFGDWLSAFKEIVDRQLHPYSKKDVLSIENPLLRYIFGTNDYGAEFRFPCKDIRCLLRAFVEVCSDNSLVIQDITDLVEGGYYEPNEAVCDWARKALTEDYPINEKIIILTEGSTDKNVLEQSLKLLYPHLYEYYAFMDFGLSNASGGASFLVTAIKAFCGSGINNRVVAIFDNDTAARVARKGLVKTTIPNNIKMLEYPILELAKNYPTVGPSGISNLDINGLACSIELYFGSDILTKEGNLVPIQWKGYDDTLNQYQGEILHKHELQEGFFRKLAKCFADKRLINDMDWKPMYLVLQAIFAVFQ